MGSDQQNMESEDGSVNCWTTIIQWFRRSWSRCTSWSHCTSWRVTRQVDQGQPTGNNEGNSNNQDRPAASTVAPSEVALQNTNEMTKKNKKFANLFKPAPKTRINIKAGKGATIIAGEDTLQNAQIDVESRTGQNNVVALGHNGNYTVTTADGRLQKQAGGEFVHTPGTALTGGTSGYKEIEN